MKITLWLGITTARGTWLKTRSIRKVGNHCSEGLRFRLSTNLNVIEEDVGRVGSLSYKGKQLTEVSGLSLICLSGYRGNGIDFMLIHSSACIFHTCWERVKKMEFSLHVLLWESSNPKLFLSSSIWWLSFQCSDSYFAGWHLDLDISTLLGSVP